jgi:hypothetical protein
MTIDGGHRDGAASTAAGGVEVEPERGGDVVRSSSHEMSLQRRVAEAAALGGTERARVAD